MHILLIIMLLFAPAVGAQTLNRVTLGGGVTIPQQYTPEQYFTAIPHTNYFTVPPTSGCMITAYDVAGGLDVKIPPTINGLPVIAIDDGDSPPPDFIPYGVFCNKGLTSVTLPDTLLDIGMYAFAYNNLTTILLPSSIQKIKYCAFRKNLLSGTIVFNLHTLTPLPLYIFNAAFDNDGYGTGNAITAIVLPDNSDVGVIAFADNPITKITIGTNVRIGTNNADVGIYGAGFRDAYTAGGAGTYNYTGGAWIKE